MTQRHDGRVELEGREWRKLLVAWGLSLALQLGVGAVLVERRLATLEQSVRDQARWIEVLHGSLAELQRR